MCCGGLVNKMGSVNTNSVNGVAELHGKVIDLETQQPLPGASITIVDPSGQYLGDGVAADRSGLWMLASGLFMGNFVMFTNVGYEPVTVAAEDLGVLSVVGLLKKSSVLDPVVVTPDNNKKSKIPWWIIGIIGVTLLYKK